MGKETRVKGRGQTTLAVFRVLIQRFPRPPMELQLISYKRYGSLRPGLIAALSRWQL